MTCTSFPRGLLSLPSLCSTRADTHHRTPVPRRYPQSEWICHRGSIATCMYIILQGEISVVVDEMRMVSVAKLHRGDFFGERSLFGLEKRNASIMVRHIPTVAPPPPSPDPPPPLSLPPLTLCLRRPRRLSTSRCSRRTRLCGYSRISRYCATRLRPPSSVESRRWRSHVGL